MRVGSLFSGYRGLDMAVEQFFGAETVWWSDIDKGAIKINQHHWPDQPNLGDITKVDWSDVEPVDILTGGFPCQDLSHAGKRAGLRPGTRSGLWSHMAYAISQLRPRYVIAENVRGLLSASADSSVEQCAWCVGGAGDGEPHLRALGAVLGDLAELGYDTQWVGLRAADVGAPHGRFRVFITAADTRGEAVRLRPRLRKSEPSGFGRGRPDNDTCESAADADATRLEGFGGPARTAPARRGGHAQPRLVRLTPADPAGDGRDEGWTEPARLVGGSDAAERGDAFADPSGERHGRGEDGRTLGRVDSSAEGKAWERERARAESGDRGVTAWGAYEPAIRRWEGVLGHHAPSPTETSSRGSQRLSPQFVEWMMGLPAGHVCDVPGLTRNEQLKALGNGVVPAQAYAALGLMLGQEMAA